MDTEFGSISISPGYTWTPAMESKMIVEFGSVESGKKVAASRNPLGVVSVPEDVAHAAVFLSSQEARMVTAFDFVIDGGMLHS